MTLSILATQASPAPVNPASAVPDEACESPQNFATVLRQEGQQDVAVDADPAGKDSAADPAELSVETEETVAALVSALLGAMPALTEAVAADDEVDADAAPADQLASGDEATVAATSLTSALLTLTPSQSSSPDVLDSAGARGDMAITEHQLLPPGGKTLPGWSRLMQSELPSRADTGVATIQSPASPATIAALGVDSTTLPNGFDNKAFQTLLRSEPLLAGLAGGAGNTLDGASTLNDVTTMADTSLLAANRATATTSTASSEAMPGLPLRSPAFGTLLANQVLWQAKVGNNEAAIRLDPPELGPIDVRISQVDNETHLHFTVGHGLTRDQLEQAVPRLRELFSQGGLSLGQVLVEQGSRDNASQRDGGNGNSSAANARANATSETAPVSVRLLNGLIDDYA